MGDLVISLLEVDAPFITHLSEPGFMDLKNHDSAGATAAVGSPSRLPRSWIPPPEYDIMQGFLRSIRSENIDKHIATLSVESTGQQHQDDPNHLAEQIGKVIASAFESSQSPDDEEVEYRVCEGQLTTGRIYQENPLNARLRSLSNDAQLYSLLTLLCFPSLKTTFPSIYPPNVCITLPFTPPPCL